MPMWCMPERDCLIRCHHLALTTEGECHDGNAYEDQCNHCDKNRSKYPEAIQQNLQVRLTSCWLCTWLCTESRACLRTAGEGRTPWRSALLQLLLLLLLRRLWLSDAGPPM